MAQDARDALEDALDDLSDEGQLFIGKYAVRSSMDVSRPGGGQGLVQFARDQAHNTEVAIKVYLVERLPSAGIFVFRMAAALAYVACRNQYRCTTARLLWCAYRGTTRVSQCNASCTTCCSFAWSVA